MKVQLSRLLPLLAALFSARQVDAKAVFAHFMVGNVPSFSVSDWESDIALAQASGIDGFVLNMASQDSSIAGSVQKAFTAAGNKNFKLFFSFDYEAQGAWSRDAVIGYINQYKNTAAYYKGAESANRPLVSTFEGPGSSGDWPAIKDATGAFFVPDWSSLGPQAAASRPGVDGLFSWDAWPVGPNDKSLDSDRAYKSALGSKPYMMGVSPWFFTNLPGWGKNWLWRGDDLWYDRWQQVFTIQPELVQIISWNDYGEAHYIGPLRDSEYGLFEYGKAPYNYVADMPHDGWRQFLPYLIAQYKSGSAPAIKQEGLTTWYRRSPSASCGTGGTTGNSQNQGQQIFPPGQIAQDRVFFSALLSSSASVTVSIGGNSQSATWENVPSGGSGIYHGSAPFNGRTGEVVVTVTRNGQVAQVKGAAISNSCTNNIANWNAWVGSSSGGGSPPSPTSSPQPQPTNTNPGNGQACVKGTGQGNFLGLCDFSCHYNYCPPSVCTCTEFGNAVTPPASTGRKGYPLPGLGCGYAGLCSFVYDHGYYPDTACGTDPAGAAGC